MFGRQSIAPEESKKLVALKNVAVEHFKEEDWLELGALTGRLSEVKDHDRLLRSLSWGDADYGGHAFSTLISMAEADPRNLEVIDSYISKRFPGGGENISSTEGAGKRIYFTPSVFEIPSTDAESDLLSVMMPFDAGFTAVHAAVVEAGKRNGMRCQRADDIWQHTAVIQDIFSLIFRSFIVVCDFSGKNPNVFYEAGIAHTLGKHVIPITQHGDDIPFDLRAHRYLHYHNNAEGRDRLTDGLAERIATLHSGGSRYPWR